MAGHVPGLTPRQAEMVWLVAEGLTDPAIGRRLYLSTDTVKMHLTTIRRHLGARNRAHLVHLAWTRQGQP